MIFARLRIFPFSQPLPCPRTHKKVKEGGGCTHTTDVPRMRSSAADAWIVAAVASLSLRLVWLAEDSRRALGCVAEAAVIPRALCAGTTRIAALVKVGDVVERGGEMGVLALPTGAGAVRAVVAGAAGGCWLEREIEVVGAARGTDRGWDVDEDAARDKRESAATGALLSPSVGGMAVRGRRSEVGVAGRY